MREKREWSVCRGAGAAPCCVPLEVWRSQRKHPDTIQMLERDMPGFVSGFASFWLCDASKSLSLSVPQVSHLSIGASHFRSQTLKNK